MKNIFYLLASLVFLSFNNIISQNIKVDCTNQLVVLSDFYTPKYYKVTEGDSLKTIIDNLVNHARKVPFQHPLKNSDGNILEYSVPIIGEFGAGKGPTGTEQHHPAIDLHLKNDATNVQLFAAYDGFVEVFRDSPKYRHYLKLSKIIKDSLENAIGKMVTIYAHIDLDLDSASGLLPNGTNVNKGDIISENLFSGTVGGPHLHFEIRYYKPTDIGNEEFYSFVGPMGSDIYTEPSAGIWSYGYWDPSIGYGYANPENHWQDSITSVERNISEIPEYFNLFQNYPNPFNPSTDINFQLPKKGFISLKVYDVLGREVATLVNEEKIAGKYSVKYNASNLPSGVYLYQLKAENYNQVNKMILQK